MKGLKWGLSFNSSRPNRQTKKLWTDANIKCSDEDFDINKMKVLVLFLDVSLSAQDPPAQRSVIDELSEDLVGIFQALVFWTKLCQSKIKQVSTFSSDDVALINEVMMKALSVVEILSTVKGTKVSLRDLIVSSNPCIRSVLEALPVMESLTNKLSLIRILRAVMFSEAHLIELAKVDGFRTLSAVVTDTNEPALTSQVMHLQRLYMEYIQSAKQAQLLRQEHLTHNITLSNISNLSQMGASGTSTAYHNAQYSKASDVALRTRAYSTSSAGSASGAYTQSGALRGGANSSAANSAQARLYTLSASTAASTANLTATSLHGAGGHSSSAYHLSTHSNGQLNSMYHSSGQLHGAYHSNGLFYDPNPEDTSMAAKGLNLAFNFVNELLKFAPISADWLQAQRPNKDALLLHDHLSQHYDEQLALCNMLLSPAVLELESERVRQLERGLDPQQALESADQGEDAGGDGEVGLVLPTDSTEPNNERSLLYTSSAAAHTSPRGSTVTVVASDKVNGQLVVSVNTSVSPGAKTQLSPTHDGSSESLLLDAKEMRPATTTNSPHNMPRAASRQSSRETGFFPAFPSSDPLEYIRNQMQEQDLSSVLLLAIAKAATPSEGLEALTTLQAMLVGDAVAQSCFVKGDGYSKVSTMLLHIEENLVLLVPVTDSSMAAAAGQGAGQSQRHDPNRRSTSSASTVSSYDNTSISGGLNGPHNTSHNNNNSPHKHSRGDGDKSTKESGLYNHTTKGEFDVYYSTVVMILLNIILDDIITTQISGSLPFLPLRGAEIGNYKALQLLFSLLCSGSSGLCTVGLRIVYALIKVHAPNVLVLESAGVTSALVELLCTILYTKSIDTSALTALFTSVASNNGELSARESVSDYNEIISKSAELTPLFGTSGKNVNTANTDTPFTTAIMTEHCSHQLLHTLVSDLITILQIVSVATANRDSSVVCLLTYLVQQCSTYYRMVNLHSSGCSTVNSVKCQNCEMETACLQCLNDGCMNDQSFLLCQECDNVFHKSTVKKSHIRIPVLPSSTTASGNGNGISQSNSQDKLHIGIARDNSGSIRTDNGTNTVITGINDTYRLPLCKHNLLDSSNIPHLPDPAMANNNSSQRGYDGQFDNEGYCEHDMSSAVCNESFLCVLLAGIRGILDDREVRGLGLPHLLFPSLLITLRTAVSDPFKIHNRNGNGGNNANIGNSGAVAGMDELYGCYSREMFRLPDQVRLCELVDGRTDVLTLLSDLHTNTSPSSASHKDKSTNNNTQHSYNNNSASYFSAHSSVDSPTPPEVTHNSSRRVRLSLLVQCIARFVMSRSIVDTAPSLFASDRDGYTEMSALFKHSAGDYEHATRRAGNTSSRAVQVQTLQQLMAYGGDALLIHVLVDSSIYTQSTTIDKQYIVWLLRECMVASTCVKYEHNDRFYAWLLWVIRGNVSTKGSSDATRNRQRIVRRQSKTISGANNNVKNALPSVPPLGRTSSNIAAFTSIPSTAPLVTLTIRLIVTQELRLLLHTVGEDPTRHTLAHRELFEYPHLVHLNSIAFNDNASEAAGASSSSSSKKRAVGPQGNSNTTSGWAGGLHNCLFSSFTTRKHLVSAGFVDALLDLIIGELCTPVVYSVIRDPVAGRSSQNNHHSSSGSQYHEHKSLHITELEKEEWWSAFAALCALLQGCDEAKDALHCYVGIEAFVKFLLPLIEYTTTFALDAQSSVDYRAVFNTLVVELCTKHGQFAAPAAPLVCAVPRLPAQLLLQSFRAESAIPTTDKHKLSKLFVRYATHKHNSFNVHPSQHSPRKTASVEEHSSVSSLSALSPVYYLHERTAFLAGHTAQPLPLSLQNERFRRSFAIFGVSLPGPAVAAANVNTTTPVVPNKQHTNVSRNSLKASDVFDSRGRLSIDSSEIAASIGASYNNNNSSHSSSALRKLHMRRNVSTASIHSAESECHWETESIGVASSTQGDALGRASLHSLHSAHSMIALSQAIGAQSTPQAQHSRSTTPAVSVSGDLHTSSHGYATHYNAHRMSDKQWDSSTHGRGPQSFWEHHPQSAHAKLKSLGGGNNSTSSQYPFPPMILSNNSVYPCVYVPLLASFENGQEPLSTSTLLLLHHSLLIRAGYTESIVPSDLLDTPLQDAAQSRQYSEDPIGMRMSFMSSDSTHGHMQLLPESVPDHFSAARIEGVDCSVVLRKHLSMFMLSGAGHQRERSDKSERDVAYQPAYSRLQIRSPECCELLLSAAVVSAQQNQTFFLSTLSCMLDGNPANAHAFVIKPSTCIGLSRLMASLREGAQEKVGYLLSQVLRYSLQQPILRELVDVVKKGRSMSIDLLEEDPVSAAAEDGADCKSLLFVMGRTAERVGPESFLHFDLGSPFHSRVELPSITSLPVPTVAGSTASNGVTVCSWVRLGSLADAPTCAFLQLHSDSSDLLVDVYFRVVYKLTPKAERSNTDSSGCNSVNGPAQQISKRVVQLCLSFGKSTTSEGAWYDNGVPVPVVSNNPASASALQNSIGKFWSDQAHAEDDAARQQSHWRLAVDQFCHPSKDIAGADLDLPDQPHELHDAAVVLANTLCHFALPDAIVEFDWSEMGDWHLLVLGLSAEQITCSIDSIARPVLHWSPLGYQYDARSAAIKQSTDDSIPVLKDPTNLGANGAPSVEPLPVREIGLHAMDFTKALPVAVTVGGMRHEQPAYDLLRNHLTCAANEENAHAELGLASLVQSFDTTVSGFSGTLGEVAIMAGVVEDAKVLACLRGGPIGGFRELKANRLSALTSSAVRAPRRSPSIKSAGDSEKTTPSLSFPSFLAPTAGVSNNIIMESSSMNIYASNYALVIKEKDDLFGKTRSAKDSNRDAHAVKFTEGVQIHQTMALVGAFNSIGGIRALYPLLAADKARLVAALRIIGSLISASMEASQDFRVIEADKVILYCCVQNPRLVTIETVQVLFDMAMESTHALQASNNPASAVISGNNTTASVESIQRGVILELLLDIVVALPRNTQLARSAIDWLREICDDHLPNCQKVLKTPGLMPILIMLAAWELPGCENLPRGAALASERANQTSKTSAASAVGSTVTESALVDASSSSIRRGRSASLGSAPEKQFDLLRSSQVIDISKAATAKLTESSSKKGLSSGSADERVLGRGPVVRAHNDSKLRLMDRVNMEYLQKTLADEQDAAATHAIYTERYKLQLSCSRLIRLLISGTSGEVAHVTGNVVLNLNNTSTEFSAQYLAMLLSFAVVAGSTKHVSTEENAASVAHNNYSKNREQRQRAARVKRLIYGTFSGIPMLRHMDIAAPTYWINSAALVALDSIIDAINSALHVQIVSLLKNAFPVANLHSMMLHMMGSECAEIRERSLRILLFSFSSLDGKLDARQVSSFDRMHGFQCLAAQLSAHPDGCTDAILQGLLSLIFWRRNKRRASSSNGSEIGERRFSIDSHNGEDDEGFFPIKTTTVSPDITRPSSLDLRHQQLPASTEHTPRASMTSVAAPSPAPTGADILTAVATAGALSSAEANPAATAAVSVVAAPITTTPRSPTAGHSSSSEPSSSVATSAAPASSSTSTAATQPSGSLLSLFSWGGSAPVKQTTTAAIATTSTVPATPTAASAAPVTVSLATGKVDVPIIDDPRGSEFARKDSSNGSDSHTVNTEEEKPPSDTNVSKPQAIDDARTAVNHKIYLVDVIEVPQALEALFAVLENSRSAEQVTGTLKVLEQSVSVTAVASSMHQELSMATNVLHLRNAENFFAQKDWLMWLCDLLVLFARQAMHVEDQEGSASVFSLSESESLTGTGAGAAQGYYGGGYYDPEASGEDSESNSVAGDYFSEDPSPNFHPAHRGAHKGGSVGSGESLSGRVSSWQQQLIDQYCAPIYNLIRKLMLQDMTAHKPSSARRWNELFRLSLPELNTIQERLLTDLIVSMQNLSEFCEDVTATVNLLKNLSALLEQALEKVDLSLVFCVKVVQALHTLTYNCAPEVRSRIKETALPEMRKQFVVRCLLDNSQDYYNKVAAISEISSPLTGYVSSTEAKPLTDTNVVMIVLGMLVEACEDLEFLLGGVDSSDVVLNESAGSLRGHNNNHHYTSHNNHPNDEYRLVGSPVPTNTYDRVHLLFEVLEVLIESVQNCVLSSAECRKCVSKLVQNIPGDPKGFCLAAFSKSFNQQTSSAKSSRSSSLIGGVINPTTGQSDFPSAGNATGSTGVENDIRIKNNGITSTNTTSAGSAVPGAASNLSASILNTTSTNTTTQQQQQQQQQSNSYSWWGGWGTNDSTTDPNSITTAAQVSNEKIDAPRNNSDRDLEAGRSGKHNSGRLTSLGPELSHPTGVSGSEGAEEEVLGPANIRAFISWFCSFDQRELQGEFRVRVLNEIRPTHRATDKLREKTAQRYMRHSRQAQEKRTKEKAYISRTAKDALNTVKSVTDKVSTKFQKDTKSWVAGINDKFEGGKTVFNNSFEDRLSGAKSPLKDLKTSNQPLYTHNVSSGTGPHPQSAAGANSVHNSTQPGVFSERLKRFLLAGNSNQLDHLKTNMSFAEASSTAAPPATTATTTEGASRSAALMAEYDASSALNDLLAYFQQNVSANSVN